MYFLIQKPSAPSEVLTLLKVFRGCIQVNADLCQRVDNDCNICVDVRLRLRTFKQIQSDDNAGSNVCGSSTASALSAEFRHILTLTAKLLNDVLLARIILHSRFLLWFNVSRDKYRSLSAGAGGEQKIFVTVVNCLMRLMGRRDEILRIEQNVCPFQKISLPDRVQMVNDDPANIS